ncbi:MAG TPA: PQQ-binding-like beta-propeller repeat protein, partial [Blastocatellia bacterium]|nr:PQQ-binding-like beta-propeller repeat protein [Blastocatellia bacterium]
MRRKSFFRFITLAVTISITIICRDAVSSSSVLLDTDGSHPVTTSSSSQTRAAHRHASILNRDWPAYAGGQDGDHYSPVSQINRDNVKQLQVAWSFDTGESGGLQTSPIVVDSIFYGISPSQKVFALDAATGALIWKFDSGIKTNQPDRGLCYWSPQPDARKKLGQVPPLQNANRGRDARGKDESDARVLVGVMNFLYALDAKTGQPIPTFGKNGRIDLREDLGRDPEKQSIALTTPGIIYQDLIIVGGRDPETLPAPPGDIRAYDVRTGKLRWTFHTIPHPGEFGYKTWPKGAWKYSGAANNWAGMAVDAKRGILYVPTGSAAFDFYGADRAGDDLFANCLIALNAHTGKRIWHFQGVKHDLWDRDFPSHPSLV